MKNTNRKSSNSGQLHRGVETGGAKAIQSVAAITVTSVKKGLGKITATTGRKYARKYVAAMNIISKEKKAEIDAITEITNRVLASNRK